jgi:hypothetical protein
MSDRFEPGMRVRPRGWSEFGVVEDVIETPTGWRLYVNDSAGHPVKIEVEADGAADIEVLHSDGGAEPKLLLAGLWAEWMRSARRNGEGDSPRVDDSSAVPPPGRSGVHGAMLPQPQLRIAALLTLMWSGRTAHGLQQLAERAPPTIRVTRTGRDQDSWVTKAANQEALSPFEPPLHSTAWCASTG